MPLVVQLVGSHGSGKTVALTRVVRRLRRSGWRVTVLKHSHHAIDLRGTDTDRYRRSGANAVVFAGRDSVAFLDGDPLRFARSLPSDVLLIEGYHARRLGRRFRIDGPHDVDRIVREIRAYLERKLRGPSPRRPARRRRA